MSKRSLLALFGVILGFGAVYCVVKDAGPAATWLLVRRALPFLPLALAIEGGRIVTEVMAAMRLFAMLKSRVPARAVAKAQFVGYAICNVVPVGRVACEAAKAGILAEHAALPTTAAVGAVTQALHLMASGLVLIPCVLAACATHAPWALTLAIAGNCAVLVVVGSVVFGAAYHAPVESRLLTRIPKVARALEAFRAAVRQLPHFPVVPLVWLMMTRVLQVVLILLLARALAAPLGVAGALVAQAVLQVGASAFDVVPGQIGALEGMFRFFADSIGVSAANAVAIALLLHVVQACWVLVGAALLALGHKRSRGPHAMRMPRGTPAARGLPRTDFSGTPG